MYNGTGFYSKLKLILKPFPLTMWSIQNYMKMALANNGRWLISASIHDSRLDSILKLNH